MESAGSSTQLANDATGSDRLASNKAAETNLCKNRMWRLSPIDGPAAVTKITPYVHKLDA
jgi:hypothetical protein